MLSLNIDTSQNITSVSVSSEKEILHLLEEDNERPNHCELLSPMIKKLFNILSLEVKQITEVRVNIGPGNLSSLRVGISTANVFGSFSNIPVYGISSFLPYALNCSYNNKSLIVVFDLKNNNLAYARFVKKNSEVSLLDHNFKITSDSFKAINFKDSSIVGTGSQICREILKDNLSDDLFKNENFNTSSRFLYNIDLNYHKKLIFKDSPLAPFNSYSFIVKEGN